MLPSGLPEAVADEEDIARFLTSSRQFNATMAKPGAFMPITNGRTEASVSRHGRVPEDRLWVLGMVAAGDRNLHGAAILKAQAVRRAGLEVRSDEPPIRHGAITGWTEDRHDAVMAKARWMEAAALLASSAELVRCPVDRGGFEQT